MLHPARDLSALVLSSLALMISACDGGGAGTTAPDGSGGAGGTAGAGGMETTAPGGSGGTGGVGGTGGAETTGGGGSGGAPAPTALVHRVGRFDESDASRPAASWSGTTYRTKVSGTSLTVKLGGATGVIFQVEVDGAPIGKFKTTGGDKSYDVATDLPAGEHDIALVRRNEGYFGAVSFLGFEPGADSMLVETPWPYVHTMELIGDSLTAGYGIEGASATCNFSADTESFYGTYGAIAGRNVNAAVHAIAFSGKGVYQNYGGDKNQMMPELWLRTITNDPASPWDFSKFTPEAVVINLGTNDFSAPINAADFVGAYVTLLGEVRKRYKDAMIFCVTWAHWGQTSEGWVTEAMAMTGDPKLRRVGFSIDPKDGLGCDYHTNLVTNAKLGEVLTQALKTELGW